jgi:hypothetical protein
LSLRNLKTPVEIYSSYILLRKYNLIYNGN